MAAEIFTGTKGYVLPKNFCLENNLKFDALFLRSKNYELVSDEKLF